MKDVDFAGLNSTIEDFEKTVGALERINDISRQTSETAEKIDALCKLLSDTSSHVVGSSNDVKQELSKFSLDFQRSAAELLSVKGDIVESNEQIGEAVATTSSGLSQEIVATRQVAISVQDKLDEEERKLSEKLISEASSLRTVIELTGRRIEDQVQLITSEVSKIQGIRDSIDAVKKQNAEEKTWIVLGSIAACVAMIASVVGLFI